MTSFERLHIAHTVARNVAQELGPPWKYDRGIGNWIAKIGHLDGAGITLRTKGERIQIVGWYPGNHIPYGTTVPKITAAISRGPEAIAKDIRKRFLPKYLPLFESCREREAEAVEYKRKEGKGKEALAAILGSHSGSYDGRIHFRGPGESYGTINVYGTSVTLGLRSMDLDAALDLARHLRKTIDA